ncbi:ABC transporter permease [Chitinophaga vietnamensis]|uniref:ABC transporter permease n=1 Tax=Chitinophaga vietnamensis TaxID=2593957 RepID=UPI0011787047|nr:ABC transporter permease [Chitinophaga vietnamensis]
MFRNYFKTTFRNLWKNKSYSFLNIFGLSIGIVCAAMVLLWVEDEVTFNNNHLKKDHLYLVQAHWFFDGSKSTFSSTCGPMAAAMRAEIPGVVNTCRSNEYNLGMLFANGKDRQYANGRFIDSSVFSMFTLPFLEGNPHTAFQQVNSIVLSQTGAKKIFGTDHQVVGRTLTMDNKYAYTVTGLMKDLPENSSMRMDWMAPFDGYRQFNNSLDDWSSNGINTFVELSPTADVAKIDRTLFNYIQQRVPKAVNHAFLFPMNDWRLRDNFVDGVQTGGRITFVKLFSTIAWIILLVACINFMNLATARSEQRAREVGVRKVLGAGKGKLVTQFIGESMIMSLLATMLAVLIITLLMPVFNTLTEKHLSLGLDRPTHIAGLLALTIICGLIAGSYPAMYLSSFQPIAILKGFKLKNGSATMIRKGLVIAQFSVSIILIIATVIIYQQIQHVKSRDLGFNKDRLLSIDIKGDAVAHFPMIKQELLNTNIVSNAALTDYSALYAGNSTSGFRWKGKPANSNVLVSIRMVSHEYMRTAGLQIIDGSDFQPHNDNDTSTVIVTESFAKIISKGSVIGENLEIASPYGQGMLTLRIAGVVKDYVYGNMYGTPSPVVFFPILGETNKIYARIKPGIPLDEAVKKIGEVMQRDNPDYPFTYAFVDDQFNHLFQDEMLIDKLSRIFAGLTIIISCLGLFGLAAYTAERRTKEIGIRKTLGASVANITAMLSADFLKLVCFSMLIAFPLAWWAMSRWLQQYPYRTQIHMWVFLLAGILAIIITLLTISYQSIRAALTDPVKSLKTE